MKIIELESVDSTNEYCKRQRFKEDFMVFSKVQTGGRGTKGRSFCSEEGGLYLSVTRYFENFPATNAFALLVNASVAVCKTLESFGIKPQIRWANDVLVNGKKICGTLIENTFSGGFITRSVIGCGLNVNNKLPEELADIAVSMSEILKKELPLEDVKRVFCEKLQKNYSLEEYKSYMDWLGCEVLLKTESGQRKVMSRGIAEDGRLIAEYNGKTEFISSAEVSLRF